MEGKPVAEHARTLFIATLRAVRTVPIQIVALAWKMLPSISISRCTEGTTAESRMWQSAIAGRFVADNMFAAL
jgi:hypothetical protein